MFSIGENIYLGQVRSHPAKSFDEFVASLASPSVVAVTREDYMAMPRGEQMKAKATRFFTAGRYRVPDGSEVALKAAAAPVDFSMVCIDIDNPEEARNWLDSPQERLPWAHYIYHSLSSTKEAPRIRVLVGTETLPLDQYLRMVSYLGEVMHIELNPESKSPVFAMYVPTVFRDEERAPTITRASTLPLLTLEETPEISETRRRYQSSRGADDTPLPGITLGHAETMLRHISPDCGYSDWCMVCCALQHQFAQISNEDAEEAFMLFDRWSSGGLSDDGISMKYEGEAGTYRKWRAFDAVGKRTSITVRSLIFRAKEHGWAADDMCSDAHDALVARIQAAKTPTEVESRILNEIARHDVLTDVDRQSLVQQVVIRLNALGRRVGNRVVSTILKERMAEQTRSRVPDSNWCSSWCYVASFDKWYDLSLVNPEPISPPAFRTYHSDKVVVDARGPDEFALKNGAIKAQTKVYDPRCLDIVVRLNESAVALNTYKASYPSADPTKADEAGAIFDEHLAYLFADPEHARTLKDWMAWVIQHPGDKTMWAPVIQGVQGCGKSVIGRVLSVCVGHTNARQITTDLIGGQWNDWAETARVLIFEEIDTLARGVADRLKLIITSEEMMVVEKFRSSISRPSYCSCIFILNDIGTFHVNENERRYYVLRCRQQQPEDIDKTQDYWDRLWRLEKSLGGGIRHHLMMHETSPNFNPRGAAPATVFKTSAAVASKSAVVLAIEEALASGNPDMTRTVVRHRTISGIVRDAQAVSLSLSSMGYLSTTIMVHGKSEQIWYKNGVDLASVKFSEDEVPVAKTTVPVAPPPEL
jgi:hypothetical protein